MYHANEFLWSTIHVWKHHSFDVLMLYVLQVLSRSARRCQSEALNKHADVVAELFGCVSIELRGGFAHAVDTFVGFSTTPTGRCTSSPLIRSHPPGAGSTWK
jgi:hypothetical protein